MHRQVEVRIVVVYRSKQLAHFDLSSQFFANLALQGLLQGFTRFNLASRNLPPVLPFAVASLRSEDASFVVTDNGCYYLYGFSIWSHGLIQFRVQRYGIFVKSANIFAFFLCISKIMRNFAP